MAYSVRSFDHSGPDWVDENLTITKDPKLTSFGNVSMQVRRAAETLGYNPEALSSKQSSSIISALEDPIQNLYIVAKHLRELKEVDFKDIPSNKLTENQIKVIASRYNRGPHLPLEQINSNLSYGNSKYRHKTEIDRAKK